MGFAGPVGHVRRHREAEGGFPLRFDVRLRLGGEGDGEATFRIGLRLALGEGRIVVGGTAQPPPRETDFTLDVPGDLGVGDRQSRVGFGAAGEGHGLAKNRLLLGVVETGGEFRAFVLLDPDITGFRGEPVTALLPSLDRDHRVAGEPVARENEAAREGAPGVRGDGLLLDQLVVRVAERDGGHLAG